jgi:hypothetical protein
MISRRRRVGAAIALIALCCLLSIIGQARHDVHQQWSGECVALLVGAGMALLAALMLIGTERGR